MGWHVSRFFKQKYVSDCSELQNRVYVATMRQVKLMVLREISQQFNTLDVNKLAAHLVPASSSKLWIAP